MASVIASKLVPSPPAGSPPVQASGTSLPTIWRTMSAAPSATFGECDTMTMPTLAISSLRIRRKSPRSSATMIARRDPYGRSNARRERKRGRASRASAPSPRPRRAAVSLTAAGSSPAANACAARDRERRASSSDPTSLLPRALTAAMAAREGLRRLGRARVRAGKLLAQRQEQRAVERPRGAADLHHELRADRLEQIGQAHRRKRIQVLQHRLKSPLHVVPVIAVADCGVERRQLVGHGRRRVLRPRRSSRRFRSRIEPDDFAPDDRGAFSL